MSARGKERQPRSEDERKRLEQGFSADSELISSLEEQSVTLPPLEKLENLQLDGVAPVLKRKFAPQHVNVGNHVDNAFLIDTALHAISISDQTGQTPNAIAANYLSSATAGQEFQCIVQDGPVYVVRPNLDADENQGRATPVV